jgi:hypothetical protein
LQIRKGSLFTELLDPDRDPYSEYRSEVLKCSLILRNYEQTQQVSKHPKKLSKCFFTQQNTPVPYHTSPAVKNSLNFKVIQKSKRNSNIFKFGIKNLKLRIRTQSCIRIHLYKKIRIGNPESKTSILFSQYFLLNFSPHTVKKRNLDKGTQ